MVRLPLEYQEVEYLESTGTQWIATEYIPTSDINAYKKVECEYAWTISQTGDSMLFGYVSTTALYYEYYMSRNVYAAIGLSKYRGVGNLNNSAGGINVKRHLIMDEENCSIVGGGSASPTEYYSTIVSIPMYIFAWNSYNNGVGYINKGARLYSLKFTEGESIAADFIPCYRKSDNEPGMYDTVSKTFYTNSGTGMFLVGDPVYYDTASLLERRRQILLNTPHIKTVSDTMASFKTDIATDLKGLKVYFSPVQEGTGDPSPDNVRPITGWDGVEITVCGKNLFDYANANIVNGFYKNDNGVETSTSNSFYISTYYKVKPSTRYYLSGFKKDTSYGVRVYRHDKNKEWITRAGTWVMNAGTGYFNFTTEADCYYVQFQFNVGVDISEMQLEEGTVVTPYEPYTATTITIPFPQTIYGGYVDLLKGEVVEEWVKRNLNAFSQTLISGDGFQVGHWRSSGWEKKNGLYNFISDVFKRVTGGTVNQTMKGYGNTYPILLYDSSITTVDEFKEKYADNYIVYAIRNPVTYSISPQTLKALRGINNIWSNANGNVEVSFYSH